MNTAAQEYHSNQQLSLSVFKRDQHHEDIAGFSYPRPVKLYEHPIEPYSPNQTVYRNDAPSPGASIIDLSTSSVTSLRSQGFSSSAYFEGQRYDRSPQLASSPHYSSPQMLSPQGHTLDLSVGRTQMGWVRLFETIIFGKKNENYLIIIKIPIPYVKEFVQKIYTALVCVCITMCNYMHLRKQYKN